MKIRTLTGGVHVLFSKLDEQIEGIASDLMVRKERFQENGIEVQTIRLSTQSWVTYLINRTEEGLISSIREIESAARKQGIDFISVGPALTDRFISMVPKILNETTFVCTSAFMGDPISGPVHANMEAASRAVLDISRISPDGARNFMFAGTASIPPDVPFFPAAYHGGGGDSFSIGMESGDIVSRAAERSSSLKEFQELLGYMYDTELKKVESLAEAIDDGLEYRGIDLSYAPGLGRGASIARSIEKVNGSPFGSHGTLSSAAAITRSLDDVTVKRCGYSGLMLPILEDEGLAGAANMGSLDLQKLLLYSSVCGTGLDAVPLPGDMAPERLYSVLSDVAYLSIKWGKPLSARLLPIPGRGAGDSTELDSPYLLDCSILTAI